MNRQQFTVLTDCSLITCIVEKGHADGLVKAAREAGAQGATIHYARGTGVRERLGILSIAVEAEKEIINIVVPSDHANAIFEHMYLTGGLDQPGRGIIYITPIEKAATYIPDDVIEKLTAGDDHE